MLGGKPLDLQATAESLIILSISGGGVVPIINGMLADRLGVSLAWSLATSLFGTVFFYTLSCNVVPSFREALDVAHGVQKEADSDLEMMTVSNH